MTDDQSEACEIQDIPADDPLKDQIGGDHYKGFAIQPVEFCQRNRLPFIESCIIKYICRHGLKGKAEDLRKAGHFLRMLMWMEYEETCDGCPRRSQGGPKAEGVLRSMYTAQDDGRPWVYIAAPYTNDPENHTRRALKLADEVWQLGYWPAVPHLTHWWHERTPRSYDRWLEYGKALARRCDVVLRDKKRCPGQSPGADEEERLGVPVVHSLEELQERFPLL